MALETRSELVAGQFQQQQYSGNIQAIFRQYPQQGPKQKNRNKTVPGDTPPATTILPPLYILYFENCGGLKL